MSDVTVKQFAGDVGIPADLLLTQLVKAGLPKAGEEDVISESEKRQLLIHLREKHGKKADPNSPPKTSKFFFEKTSLAKPGFKLSDFFFALSLRCSLATNWA